MIKLIVDGKDITNLLVAPPKITDQLEGACRTLDVQIHKVDNVALGNGELVQLYVNGSRWFYGFIRKYEIKERSEALEFKVYDPCYFLAKTKDDFYYKNQTGTQIVNAMAVRSGVRVKALENTEAVFAALHYPGAQADKIVVDVIARTYRVNDRKFWYRYDPSDSGDGLILFERRLPAKVWVFQPGNNLLDASYSASVEEMITVVKLVNRETGKIVNKVDEAGAEQYGPTVYFSEVGKDDADNMDTLAAQKLKELGKVKVEMGVTGINSGIKMPMFYTGDVIYVAANVTGIVGAYYIKNVTHEIISSDLVLLDFDVVLAPDIPALQYTDADEVKKQVKDGEGMKQEYSDEVKSAIEKYGLSAE